MKKLLLSFVLSIFTTVLCFSLFPVKAYAAGFKNTFKYGNHTEVLYFCDTCCGHFTAEVYTFGAKEAVTEMNCGTQTVFLSAFAEMRRNDKLANNLQETYNGYAMAYVQKPITWGRPTATRHTSAYYNGIHENHSHIADATYDPNL